MQSFSEGPLSPPNDYDWVMPGLSPEADVSQDQLFHANGFALDSTARNATRLCEIGRNKGNVRHAVPSETAPERHITVMSSVSKTMTKTKRYLAGPSPHRCLQCKADFDEAVGLR